MLNRKLAPPFQKTSDLSLPRPIEVTLASGIKIFIIQGIQQNVVKAEVIFSAGKWFEPMIGLSNFTSSLLEKGTRSRTSDEIAETLEHYGASLEIEPGFDFISVSLYSLKTNLQKALPVFLDILREPSFPEEEWVLMRDIFLQNLKVSNEKTSYRAGLLIRKNVFGDSHPYGSAVEEAAANAITPADCQDFFKKSFTVNSIYLVGNLDDHEIKYLSEGFQSLPGRETQVVTHVPSPSSSVVQHVDKEGSLQSSIRLGKRSISKTHPDYFDLLLYNHLLGGFFGSRLMKNIREEKGLTYGIYSSLNNFRNDGIFIIGADVNKTNLALAISEIKSELRKMREEVVGEQEFVLAKNHFIGGLQADMSNLFSVADKIKNIQLNALPQEYYANLFSRVDQVSRGQILSIAEKYFNEESLFEVAVG